MCPSNPGGIIRQFKIRQRCLTYCSQYEIMCLYTRPYVHTSKQCTFYQMIVHNLVGTYRYTGFIHMLVPFTSVVFSATIVYSNIPVKFACPSFVWHVGKFCDNVSASILLTIAVTMSEAYLYFSRENYGCSSYINYVLDIDVVPIETVHWCIWCNMVRKKFCSVL